MSLEADETPQTEAYHPSPGRSRNMAAIRRADTRPERIVRSQLHRRGLRFRKDLAMMIEGRRVRPDVVFTRRRVAVFIDGCFWHSCPEHGRRPAQNTDYWRPKLQRNAERDTEQTQLLAGAGWRVLRFWEHEPVDGVVAAICVAVREPDSALLADMAAASGSLAP